MNGRNDWLAEDDARTLERAEEIKNDKLRYGKAINAAKHLIEVREDSLSALKKIAGRTNTSRVKHSDYGQTIFENSIANARR